MYVNMLLPNARETVEICFHSHVQYSILNNNKKINSFFILEEKTKKEKKRRKNWALL